MQLLTKSIEKALTKHPLYSQEKNENPKVLAKFFNPCGRGTWYITEGSKQDDGDWLLFGLCCLQCAELGYGLTIERDRHFSGTMADAKRIENYLCNC